MNTDKLINFRNRLNIPIVEMARRIGVTPSFYSKVELGQRNPSYNFLVKFKIAFNDEASIEDIFFDK